MGFRLHGASTFPKSERLQQGHQFRSLFERGRRFEGGFAVVYVLQESPEETVRARGAQRAVGIVTSRRIGGAVQRNRARRLLREAYRLNKQKLKTNLQMVIVARAAIRGKKLREVEAELVGLFQAAGILIEA